MNIPTTFWLLIISPLLSLGQIVKPAVWTYSVSKSKAQVGDEITINFTANIKDGFHIYSSEFEQKMDGPLPTQFTFKANKAYDLVGKINPISRVETKYEEVYGGNTYIMHGLAKFAQQVRLLTIGTPVIKVLISYQVCNEGSCVPGEDELEITGLTIDATPELFTDIARTGPTKPVSTTAKDTSLGAAASAKTQSSTDSKTIAFGPLNSPIEPPTVLAETDNKVDVSLWGFVFTAFLSGLIALLTPCVFPIIPMTVSFFTNQKGSVWKALLYGFSIIAI